MKIYKPIEVLVIEDNPDDSELTIRAVRQGNPYAHIVHKTNGQEALQFISTAGQTDHFQLIMLDLGLPLMDGLAVLKKLRSMEATRTTPVVILTSSEKDSIINAAYKLGANSYVVKPTRFESYIDAVTSVTQYWSGVNSST